MTAKNIAHINSHIGNLQKAWRTQRGVDVKRAAIEPQIRASQAHAPFNIFIAPINIGNLGLMGVKPANSARSARVKIHSDRAH